jgi:hypothetical protein
MNIKEANGLFPSHFFLQPLDLLQMIRPVFRNHPNIVANSDWVIEFRMTGGLSRGGSVASLFLNLLIASVHAGILLAERVGFEFTP